MFSRSLLARSSPFRLSATSTTRACSRSLSTLRLTRLARCEVPLALCTGSRQLATAPAFRTETRDDTRTSPAPSGSCYVANIPYNVSAEQLKEAFSEFGKIESVRMLTSSVGGSRGAGFVQFESVADAINFVDTNAADPIFVLDRQLHVEHAQQTRNAPRPVEPSDTLMVSDFRGESADEAREMFGEYADSILAVRFDKKEVGRPSRKAFVQFRNVSLATEAMDAFKNESENPEIRLSQHRSQ